MEYSDLTHLPKYIVFVHPDLNLMKKIECKYIFT